MNTFIALLRGINVGGHNKIQMAELRELLSNFRFKNVQTYIQSGNVVFQSLEKSIQKLEQKIQEAIQAQFGFDVSIIVRTRQDLKRIFDTYPFSVEKKEKSYFTILHSIPNAELVEIASEKVYDSEEYQIINDCIYYFCEKGYGKAKFNMNLFERKLKTASTSRNYNTMVKLLSLSEDL